ncbi:peptidase S16 [Sesbania bispinosa]|nr:peptidase S16 [Sesbania bispinosa]
MSIPTRSKFFATSSTLDVVGPCPNAAHDGNQQSFHGVEEPEDEYPTGLDGDVDPNGLAADASYTQSVSLCDTQSGGLWTREATRLDEDVDPIPTGHDGGVDLNGLVAAT